MSLTNLFDGDAEIRVLHILSMFQNNQDYVETFYIPTMTSIEAMYPRVSFVYKISLGDHLDDTRKLLENFLATRDNGSKLIDDPAKLLNYYNTPSGKNFTRIATLAHIRNHLVDSIMPIQGNWTVFIDSNVYFKYDIFERLFANNLSANNIGAISPYTQQLLIPGIHPVKDRSLMNHYYDTYSFYNLQQQSYWPHCGFAKCQLCKHSKLKERIRIPEETLSDVASAFGGFCIIHNDILNDTRCRWSTFNYDHVKDEGLCEHVQFFALLRTIHGKRVVVAQSVDNIFRTI
jgi:hypothetical protein